MEEKFVNKSDIVIRKHKIFDQVEYYKIYVKKSPNCYINALNGKVLKNVVGNVSFDDMLKALDIDRKFDEKINMENVSGLYRVGVHKAIERLKLLYDNMTVIVPDTDEF